jgi:hypothetical protein
LPQIEETKPHGKNELIACLYKVNLWSVLCLTLISQLISSCSISSQFMFSILARKTNVSIVGFVSIRKIQLPNNTVEMMWLSVIWIIYFDSALSFRSPLY